MEQYERPEAATCDARDLIHGVFQTLSFAQEPHTDAQMMRLGLRLSRLSISALGKLQHAQRAVCIWETRDEAQLSMIRVLWNSLPVTPRVSSVCKLVPRFLQVYFDVLLTNAPPECIEKVVPLLLQRFASLYPVDFFLNSVHTLIIDTLQALGCDMWDVATLRD
eukprot:Skav232235  [mRNA]  locus=scaffold273:8895:16001:- [translate_table: standard]